MNSRSRLLAALLFTLVLAPSVASADAVALLALGGRADQERLEATEQVMAELLREQGHRLAAPSAASVDHPPTSAQLEQVAEDSRAIYVITAEVEPMRGQYRLSIHVYYRPAGRLEELVVTVLEDEERARLADVLRSMVRREGLGEDALRLTEEIDPEDRAQREAEEQARREAEAEREAAEAWDARVPYGADAPWMIQLQVGGRYAATLGSLPAGAQGGGGLFDAGLRLGRSFEGVDGFELRGGLDFATGTYTALGIHVGASWLGSFFVEPVFIGLGGEVGVIFTLTGSRDAAFSGRVSALFAWRPADHFYLEASLPELGYVSPGAGALTIGASLRAGYRF